MRELTRGGSLVAATIAALHSRAETDEKSRGLHRADARNCSIQTRREERFMSVDHRRRESGGSERPLSTASEASERDSASVQSSEDLPPREMNVKLSRSVVRSLMSDCEYLTEPLEEERVAGCAGSHPAVRSYVYSPIGGDSDSPDEGTGNTKPWPDEVAHPPARSNSSDTPSSTTSDEDSEDRDYEAAGDEADYRTLTPSRRLDSSTRRDDDFRWMPSTEADDGEPKSMETRSENYSSASLDRRRRTPGDRSDRDRKTRSSVSSKPPQHPGSVRASPRPRRSRAEDTPPELQRRWNSYEHFRWAPEGGGGGGGWWGPMCWCHAPPPPPCCMHDHGWPSHPSLPPTPVPARTLKNDAEERVRRMEADKESLQLQVQVLSEQISAQGEKMSDLERALHDTRQRLDDAEQRLQKEMLHRSSLETQKLELLSKLSEMRLRVAERGIMERSPPPPELTSTPLSRPAPPRTPPANYGRQIERNSHMYSSLPRASLLTPEARLASGKPNSMVVAKGRGHSVPNLAEKMENSRGSPSPSLREVRSRLGEGEGTPLTRGPLRATAAPRMLRDKPNNMPWQTIDVKQWDTETTCGWLESLGVEQYVPAARTWLNATPDARGVLVTATPNTIEKQLELKHPMHKKKILLALTELTGGDGDPHLSAAGRLDSAWTLRWLEDVGASGTRTPAAAAALDGRTLHRLTHAELHVHLHVHQALHALSIRRGIQVLRDNEFNPNTMIRRAGEETAAEGGGSGSGASGSGGSESGACAHIARWSSHRVMQWLNEIDLAEYAPNLRGAGVHGGLMLLEPRFTAELLAALLNIPAHKTLLRRHLTQRFNDLLGRDVIQQKRNAEQTLGYQPLTTTTKYKVPKKSQFSLKRKKSKDGTDFGELVCPLTDDCSGDNCTPTMKANLVSDVASAVSLPRDVTERAH